MKKSTALLLVVIAFVLGFFLNKFLLKNQSLENQAAAVALSSSNRERPGVIIMVDNGNCLIGSWGPSLEEPGLLSFYITSSVPLSQPNICSALSIYGFERSSPGASTLPVNSEVTFQSNNTCNYYKPTSTGWIKDQTLSLPKTQKYCQPLKSQTAINLANPLKNDKIIPLDLKSSYDTFLKLKNSGSKSIYLKDIIASQKPASTSKLPWTYVHCFTADYSNFSWVLAGEGWVENGWNGWTNTYGGVWEHEDGDTWCVEVTPGYI